MEQLVVFRILKQLEFRSPFKDSLKLKIGKKYNLNSVKQINVSEDFLNLGEDIRDCQNDLSYEDCQTKEYIDDLVRKCKCLPFNMRRSNNNVMITSYTVIYDRYLFRFPCARLSKRTVQKVSQPIIQNV